MNNQQKLEMTQGLYNKLLDRVSQLCDEADDELKQILRG